MKSDNTRFFRNALKEDIVFVDGLSRSGKFMLAPIVSSLDRTEHVQVRWLLEHIPVMCKMEHITENAAVSLLRTEVALLFYDLLIGRNVNLRPSDMTSIDKFRSPKMYRDRLLQTEGDEAYKNALDSNPILVFATHDVLCHPKIFFKAFPTLKILHIKRHPVDVIDSWYRKRTENMALNPRNAMAVIEGQTKPLPWVARGWEKDCELLSDMDRTIEMYSKNIEILKSAQVLLTEEQTKKIKYVYFEKIVTDPDPVLSGICDFLGTKETFYTPKVLKNERCPRVLDAEARKDKLTKIKGFSSGEKFDLLMSLVCEYEKGVK